MSERLAEIIPFPARPGPATDGHARLQMALARLDLAMAEQRQALANWRASLDALKASAGSLEAGLRRYQGELGTLGEKVAGLGALARQTEGWAGGGRISPLS
jgi:hypothetical protein